MGATEAVVVNWDEGNFWSFFQLLGDLGTEITQGIPWFEIIRRSNALLVMR